MASRRIEDLHPKFQPLVRRFIELCAQAGYTVIVTCGLRTAQDQKDLYAQGRTRPGKIVTNVAGFGWHQAGLAVDVVFVRNGRAWWDGPWCAVGAIGESLGFTWGGRWKLGDNPHFEWHPGLTLADAEKHVKAGNPIATLRVAA